MEARRIPVKAWPVLGIALMQVFLLGAHWFLFRTWMAFWGPMTLAATMELRVALILLGFSFIAAALCGFYFSNGPVRLLYWVAAVWLGMLNFLFWAACLCRIVDLALRMTPLVVHLPWLRPRLVVTLGLAAVLVSLYGMANARWVRLRRQTVHLDRLPESWRGRSALLLSDLHLGNMNGIAFSRRIAALAERLQPDVILIPGDLFDGAKADPDHLLQPLRQLDPPYGIFFSSGNHDEFGGEEHYTAALKRAGIHVLHNERAIVDGLQIVGVGYADTTHPLRMRMFLEGLKLSEGAASILLNHVPNRLPIVEGAGVSLQLSGHTHGGQLFPFTWITRRAFGRFTYGLQRFGALQVYTSTGCGAWGPPMRVGSHAEAVMIELR
jgi:predicted MPP superfamily phosphohydrolase